MTCIVCHGEDIRLVDVQEELKLEKDIVCIPIQTLVCQTCGERYYDRPTMRFLEKAAENVRSSRANLEEIGKVLIYR
jgi:hypothetical protein